MYILCPGGVSYSLTFLESFFYLISGMGPHVKVLRYLLINLILLVKSTTELQGNCSLDAAVSYTYNNRLYLFKGDKYARWNDVYDRIEIVDSKLYFSAYLFFFITCWTESYLFNIFVVLILIIYFFSFFFIFEKISGMAGTYQMTLTLQSHGMD